MRTTISAFPGLRPAPPLAVLLALELLRVAPLAAQGLYNQGETISVESGALLSVPNGYEQASGATLRNAGTTTVAGDVKAGAGSTLDLSAGDLTVTGDVINAGTTTATTAGTLR